MRLSFASILQSLILVFIGLYIGISISELNHRFDESPIISIETLESKRNILRGSVSPDDGNHTELLEQLRKSQDELKRLQIIAKENTHRGSASSNDENHSKMLERLKKSQEELKRWQSIANDLKDKHGSSLERLRELEGSCNGMNEKKDDLNPVKDNIHPFCQSIMPSPVPTAMDLWNQHMLKILSASRLPRDVSFYYHDFTARMLQIFSPRLPRSVKTTPFDWKPVENALTVAWERFQYLKLPQREREEVPVQDKPRPLKILVMGGSLLVGTNCPRMNKEMNFQFGMPKKECNWSYRIGQFLNGFFLTEDNPREKKIRTDQLFEVTKVAMGGTNTATGSVIWQYDLIPEEARNPDIVINAYSTNDMHILTVLEAESSNTTLRDRTFEMIQGFVRQVMGSKHCSGSGDELISPLLLHMDDYLGNEQRKIWETTELAQGAQVLANYYGFVSMSYADVIRDLVYGDTSEKWFSSEWWVRKKFERQIHPGMGMHVASIWIVAYNFLHLASTYCSMPTDASRQMSNSSQFEYQAGLWGLPDLENKHKLPMGQPRPQPNGLPPELTKDLLLEDITSLWQQQSEALDDHSPNSAASSCKYDQNSKSDGSSSNGVKCPFSWVSGLSLQQNNVTWIKEFFEEQSSSWNGWEISEEGGKIGFVPAAGTSNEVEARMVLDFSYARKIESITFFYMKSYGTKWHNSELEAKIWSAPAENQENFTLLEERNLLGTHNKNTSEMYTEEIVLSKPVDPGGKLQVEAKLVGGETFKIMGLAVCS